MIFYAILALIWTLFSPVTLGDEFTSKVDAENTQLETVVVTARRIEEDSQDIPVAISVLEAEDVEELIIEDLSDLSGKSPGLNVVFSAPISGASNAAAVYLRGIGQADFLLTNDPAVGVYLDDVYIARSVGAVLPLAEVERVEILRGPQGVFFGRNTIGGAINVVTKRPGDSLGGHINLKLGENGRRDISFGANLPLVTDQLSARASFSRERRDGYIQRVLEGDSLGNRNRDGGFIKLSWTSNENFQLDLLSDYVSINENSSAGNTVWLGDTAQFGRGIITDLYNLIAAPAVNLPGFGTNSPFDSRFLGVDPYESMATGPNGTDIEVFGHSLHATYELDRLRLKSISSYRDMEATFSRDADASPITLAETRSLYEQSQFSQEFQLSNTGSGSSVEWLLGAYYFEERGDNLEAADIAPAVFDVTSDPMLALSLLGDIEVRNTSQAVFGHANLTLTNKVKLGIGARFTHEKKRANVQFFASDIGFPLIGDPQASLSYDDFSPRFSAQYELDADRLLYLSISKGFKSGGFTGRYVTPTPNLQPFGRESLVAYEAGLKGLFLDKALQANIAGFFSDYDDIQILIFDGLAPQTRNAGKGEIKGVEIEARWLINSNLQFSGYASYIDAQYTSLNTEVAVELFESLQIEDQFVNTPEWSFGASLDLRASISEQLKLKAVVHVDYQGDTANDAINTLELIQKARTIVNGRLSLKHATGVEISAYGKNITDEIVIVSGAADIPTFGGVEAIYAPPRELGVELSYSF